MPTSLTVCMSLLISGSPSLPASNPYDIKNSQRWLEDLNVESPSLEQAQKAYEELQVWQTHTAQSRASHLGLELKSLMPPEQEKIYVLDRREELKRLSLANRIRLQAQIQAAKPVQNEWGSEYALTVRQAVQQMAFHYLRPLRSNHHPSRNLPLVSPKELDRLGFVTDTSFYSNLVGHSASVGFIVMASRAGTAPYVLNHQHPEFALRLEDRFAEEEGFVLPYFSNPKELISFFAKWDPLLLNDLVRENRFSLPNAIKTGKDLIPYLNQVPEELIFPEHSSYSRLSSLRQALYQYILTESDARELLTWAFERFLLFKAESDPSHFPRLLRELSLAAGTQNVFTNEFLPYLGLGQLSLRIPLSVPKEDYSLLRMENADYNPFPDLSTSDKAKLSPHRLDRKATP